MYINAQETTRLVLSKAVSTNLFALRLRLNVTKTKCLAKGICNEIFSVEESYWEINGSFMKTSKKGRTNERDIQRDALEIQA